MDSAVGQQFLIRFLVDSCFIQILACVVVKCIVLGCLGSGFDFHWVWLQRALLCFAMIGLLSHYDFAASGAR